MNDIVTEVRGQTGLITLNRPQALNALSVGMVRQLAAALLAWRADRAGLSGCGSSSPARPLACLRGP